MISTLTPSHRRMAVERAQSEAVAKRAAIEASIAARLSALPTNSR